MIFREIEQDNCFIIQQIDNKTRNILKSFCRHFFTSLFLPTYEATYTAGNLLPTDDHYYEVQGLVFPANKSFEVLHFLLEYTLTVLILKVCTCILSTIPLMILIEANWHEVYNVSLREDFQIQLDHIQLFRHACTGI